MYELGNIFRNVLSLPCLIFSGALTAQSSALTWYQYDLPPYHILRGQYAGEGPLDHMFQVWKKVLPGYEHRVVPLNITRMNREFRSDADQRCIAGSFIFPESREKWLWSKPVYVEPPAVVVTRAETWEHWGKPKSVDFGKLIANPEFRFGHFDRIYGGQIDNQIAAAKGQPNVLTIASHASGESLMKMLNRKRVDYILEYLPEIRWLTQSKQTGYAGDFVTMRIDNHTPLSPVHVGCVKTPWGEQTIARLNAAITQDMRKQVWRQYQRWLSSQELRSYFEQAQSKYFQTADLGE